MTYRRWAAASVALMGGVDLLRIGLAGLVGRGGRRYVGYRSAEVGRRLLVAAMHARRLLDGPRPPAVGLLVGPTRYGPAQVVLLLVIGFLSIFGAVLILTTSRRFAQRWNIGIVHLLFVVSAIVLRATGEHPLHRFWRAAKLSARLTTHGRCR